MTLNFCRAVTPNQEVTLLTISSQHSLLIKIKSGTLPSGFTLEVQYNGQTESTKEKKWEGTQQLVVMVSVICFASWQALSPYKRF